MYVQIMQRYRKHFQNSGLLNAYLQTLLSIFSKDEGEDITREGDLHKKVTKCRVKMLSLMLIADYWYNKDVEHNFNMT